MSGGDFSDFPNPFSQQDQHRQAFVNSAKKWLLVIAGCVLLALFSINRPDRQSSSTTETKAEPKPESNAESQSLNLQAAPDETVCPVAPDSRLETLRPLAFDSQQNSSPASFRSQIIQAGFFELDEIEPRAVATFASEESIASEPSLASSPQPSHPQNTQANRSGVTECDAPKPHPLVSIPLVDLVQLLKIQRSTLRDEALSEMKRRGFSDSELTVANTIAVGNPSNRLAVINHLMSQDEVRQERWLFMLLNDSDREVRLHAVDALATMNQEGVHEHLRSQLGIESDQTVAFRIRKVLSLR